jgi:hypothetical protein
MRGIRGAKRDAEERQEGEEEDPDGLRDPGELVIAEQVDDDRDQAGTILGRNLERILA